MVPESNMPLLRERRERHLTRTLLRMASEEQATGDDLSLHPELMVHAERVIAQIRASAVPSELASCGARCLRSLDEILRQGADYHRLLQICQRMNFEGLESTMLLNEVLWKLLQMPLECWDGDYHRLWFVLARRIFWSHLRSYHRRIERERNAEWTAPSIAFDVASGVLWQEALERLREQFQTSGKPWLFDLWVCFHFEPGWGYAELFTWSQRHAENPWKDEAGARKFISRTNRLFRQLLEHELARCA